MKACVVIPARYSSTRYPGKPLTPLLGKPMILWVAELSERAVGREHVYIATEDHRIEQVVKEAGFNTLMTSKSALTGTDRIAEAAEQINYDIYINVQGDEPLVDPESIKACIEKKAAYPDAVINGYTYLSESEDPNNVNIPKVIANESDMMIYMSRTALPGFKDPTKAPKAYKKQVCIYGFSKADLRAYSEFGRKSEVEAHEDIEILRFLELGTQVMVFETPPGSLSVDVEEDVAPVETALKAIWDL